MRTWWQRGSVAVAGFAALAYSLSGCGDNSESDDGPRFDQDSARILGPGLGLGEWSDDGTGDRRVISVSDAEAGADKPGQRTVTALVQFCAPSERPDAPVGSNWSLVLDDGDSAAAAGPLRPSNAGSPALPASGQIEPEQCAFAEVSFPVPEGALTVGATFQAPGAGEVRWSWEPEDTRV